MNENKEIKDVINLFENKVSSISEITKRTIYLFFILLSMFQTTLYSFLYGYQCFQKIPKCTSVLII